MPTCTYEKNKKCMGSENCLISTSHLAGNSDIVAELLVTRQKCAFKLIEKGKDYPIEKSS